MHFFWVKTEISPSKNKHLKMFLGMALGTMLNSQNLPVENLYTEDQVRDLFFDMSGKEDIEAREYHVVVRRGGENYSFRSRHE